MKNIFRIFKADIHNLSHNFFALVIAGGLCVLPALYAWFNIYANWDPYANTGNIRIAVANLDEGWVAESGEELCMGDGVVESLKEKDSIGWVFVDTKEEAVEGVKAGDYYAALVIEQEFTYGMYNGVAENIENPRITYYVNDKKNAVATKITDTAVSTVQASINKAFVSTVAKKVFSETNQWSGDWSDEDVVQEFIGKLEKVLESLKGYETMIDTFVEANALMAHVSREAEQDMEKGQEQILSGAEKLKEGERELEQTKASFADYSANVNAALDAIRNSIQTISEDIADAGLKEDAQTLARDLEKVRADARELSKNLAGLQGSLTQMEGEGNVVAGALEALEEIKSLADGMAHSPETPAAEVLADWGLAALQDNLAHYSNTLLRIEKAYNNQIVPQVNGMLDGMADMLLSVETLLRSMGDTAGNLGEVFGGVDTTLDALNMSLGQLKTIVSSTEKRLQKALQELREVSGEERLAVLANLLGGDPETLGDFFSEPVKVEDNFIYEIANYGSGVAPFYTTLAIWVGMTILVSVLKVHAKTKELTKARPYQLFFARYLLFFLLSQIQALIIVLGDLYWLQIQCLHPFAFWLAAAMTSLTFSLLIYALTISFGDIGKALAVVVMVIQIAGSGGTYPIEALPAFFRAVYIFFPFPYGIDAMRECIGGMYENRFSLCLVCLGVFCAAALFIGLVVRVPFIGLNHYIEKRMEDTEMM